MIYCLCILEMPMKKNWYNLFIIPLFLSFLISTLFAGAVIVDFRGEVKSNKAILKWSTNSELNCQEFQIERGFDQKTFQKIGSVNAAGNSSQRKDYVYEDTSVFRQTENTFYYRIKIIDKDGTESLFSEVVSVTPSISGVRHTWGSIKAMFR